MKVKVIFFTFFLICIYKCTPFNLHSENKEPLFSNDFHVVNVDFDEETGKPIFRRWNPTSVEIDSANTVFQNIERSPIIDPISSKHENLPKILAPENENQRTDYIDLKRNLTWARQSGSVDAVVELVIVCDKEFSDIFNQDYNRIIEYLTVYMWDVNIRYKSLPSDRISFRVNGIVVISSFGGQPFIEESRASDGRAEFGRILDRYSKWIYSQRNNVPKFDLAPLITNANLEWGGGLAYMNAACWVDTNEGRDVGTAVWNDNGGWISVTVAAHEIGHNLGAPHDDDEGAFPNGCKERGFIMSGGNDDRRYFFSSCSDQKISSFVRSNQASCLRSIQGPSNPAISLSFSAYKAPTMEEHCKRALGTQSAYIEKKDTYNCKSMRCIKPADGFVWIYNIAPVENVRCGDGGRCFRGRCRQEGFNFKNARSGLCMRDTNRFDFMTPIDMGPCMSDGTPLDKFVVQTSDTGTTLSSPFTLNGNKENGEKCLWTGNREGDTIWTDRCDTNNSWHNWEFRSTGGNGRFLLVHKMTGRCAKPSNRNAGSQIQTYAACNSNDLDMLWTRNL